MVNKLVHELKPLKFHLKMLFSIQFRICLNAWLPEEAKLLQ